MENGMANWINEAKRAIAHVIQTYFVCKRVEFPPFHSAPRLTLNQCISF